MLTVDIDLWHSVFPTELLECHPLVHIFGVEFDLLRFDAEALESLFGLLAGRAIAIHSKDENFVLQDQYLELFLHDFDQLFIKLLGGGSGGRVGHISATAKSHRNNRRLLLLCLKERCHSLLLEL